MAVSRRLAILLSIGIAGVFFFAALPHAFAADLGIQSVVTTRWPNVTITFTLPAAAGGFSPRAVRVWENGDEINGARIPQADVNRQAVDVVLAIDVSGSMKGAPLANAKAAADRFVSAMGPGDRVGVVAFGPSPRVASGLTFDRSQAYSAIGRLNAAGETALYDGVSRAVDLVRSGSAPRRAIVVLSDGKDTVSGTNLDTSVRAAQKAGVPVYAVALRSGDYDPKALAAIATASGGRLTNARNSLALVAIYGALAQELQHAYQVVYKSKEPNTPDLEIRLAVDGARVPLTKTVYADNPAFSAAIEPTIPLKPWSPGQLVAMFFTQGGIIVMMGLAVGLLAFVSLGAVIRDKRAIEEMSHYDHVQESALAPTLSEGGAVADPSRIAVLNLVDTVSEAQGFNGLARHMLEKAGLPLRSSEYITLHVIGVLIVGLLTAMISRNVLFTIIVVVAATAIPLLVVQMMGDSRTNRFEELLPDILTLMAGSLRAGWGLQQSIDLVVQQAEEPVLTEFRRVQAEVRLGLSLDEALGRAAERLDSEDFRWTASAIAIQREVGGNLSEVLETVAGTIRERAEVYRQVKALTAEGRFSAWALCILPFLLAGGMFFINPSYIGLLFVTPIGLMALGMGVVLLVIGVVWMLRVVKIDV